MQVAAATFEKRRRLGQFDSGEAERHGVFMEELPTRQWMSTGSRHQWLGLGHGLWNRHLVSVPNPKSILQEICLAFVAESPPTPFLSTISSHFLRCFHLGSYLGSPTSINQQPLPALSLSLLLKRIPAALADIILNPHQ
ncbi:hypothetical protein M0R45_035487 [Rubus argutus]|uniref:Uncharacterized protein n=1 Tax=Rubus argutus TaxID=59490 RepID=A0AAW1VX29_RUBAR